VLENATAPAEVVNVPMTSVSDTWLSVSALSPLLISIEGRAPSSSG
jgi:hypothetical protein